MSAERANNWDAIVIGGGAAGLFCAGVAGQLGEKVLVLDHAEVLGEKIRISGGGRCNFTNMHSGPANFLSLNPNFVKSALSKYKPKDFIELVKSYNIPFHEKHKGQLFCDVSAKQIVD
ncbi:MAG: NAD(P)/FAD-dependent oxidoreductase, partial [Polynucleobacter victoriensis]